VPEHFPRAGLAPERLVRAEPAAVHFSPAGPLPGDVAWARYLPAHFAGAGAVDAPARVESVIGHRLREEVSGHLVREATGHLVRAAQMGPHPWHLRRPPKPAIDVIRFQLLGRLRSAPDRQF
jgi:hypothetical protein